MDAKMIEYTTHDAPIDDSAISAIWKLVRVCFDPDPSLNFSEHVKEKNRAAAVIAFCGDTAVGFKLGFELTPEEFYSWLGGVHPDFRNRGIANRLLILQHEWCRKSGYLRVSTEALNENRTMLGLNLRHGFLVVGTRLDKNGLKVLLRRNLAVPSPSRPSSQPRMIPSPILV